MTLGCQKGMEHTDSFIFTPIDFGKKQFSRKPVAGNKIETL